ncbi:HAMP domain-containing protein, partial [Streptomyces sp. BE20]|uniref:HAMP domain-containing protein n=1 Tax=Streptomyces sp. BE20 TaxID=3002525 RepID=UPI002E76BC43
MLVSTEPSRVVKTKGVREPQLGEFLQIARTLNRLVDQLSVFSEEVTRVARQVGTEGLLGGQAQVRCAAGVWRDLSDKVNYMAFMLTDQVRNIAQVTTAVARGDLSQKIQVDAQGEILELKNTITEERRVGKEWARQCRSRW